MYLYNYNIYTKNIINQINLFQKFKKKIKNKYLKDRYQYYVC